MTISLSQQEMYSIVKPILEKKYGCKITKACWQLHTDAESDGYKDYGLVQTIFTFAQIKPPETTPDTEGDRKLDIDL